MNIKKLICFFSIIIFLLSACKNESETGTSEAPVSIAEKGLNIEPDKGLEIVEDVADFTEVKENQEYNFETDNQLVSHHQMHDDCLETEDSYYFLRNYYLYVFDKETRQYSLLCNKPDCSHFGINTCNAFFSAGCKGLEYYEGNIYALVASMNELDEEHADEGLWQETLDLYRMSLDGSERTKVCTIATAVAQTGMMDNTYDVWYAAVHRGYLYYIYTYGTGEDEGSFYANKSNTLYRISLDGKEERECICTIEYGGIANGMNLLFQGSYMYFIKSDINKGGTGFGGVYRLNTESMKLEYMGIEDVNWFIVKGDEIVYITSDLGRYYSYNMKTQEKKIFFDPEPKDDLTYGYLLYDGRYYYFNLFNIESLEYRSEVYNEQLEKVGEYDRTSFEIENTDHIYANYQEGNSDYDFMIASDGSVLYYLDKSLLETGTAGFVEVKAKQ